MRRNNGITLIALVITIIILVGITIAIVINSGFAKQGNETTPLGNKITMIVTFERVTNNSVSGLMGWSQGVAQNNRPFPTMYYYRF